jgi:integrase
MSDLKLGLRNGVYQVTGTIKIPGREKGIRVRESTGTSRLRDAETYRDKLRQEVVEREIHGAGYSLTFADCVVIYLEKGGEKRFMRPILERFGQTRVKDLNAGVVSAFALEQYGHLAPASVARFFYTPLNAAIRKGCKESGVPARTFEAPSSSRTTIEHAPHGWFGEFFTAAHFRIAVAVLFLTTTGCRVSEYCRLQLKDCLFDHPRGPRALLRKTKNGSPRMVPLTDTLAMALQRLISADGIVDGEAFVGGYAGRWSVNQAIERVCKSANLKYYSSHKLGRHAFAARLLDAGHSLQHVKDAGGWATIQIVSEVYGHLAASATDAAILDVGSQMAEHSAGMSLTHSNLQQRRKPAKVLKSLVGTTGIEPVTPTMSREVSGVLVDGKSLENKGEFDASGERTSGEPAENLQATRNDSVTRD